MEAKQEKSYPSGKIMFYSMDEQTLPCHILASPLPDLAAKAGLPRQTSWAPPSVVWHSRRVLLLVPGSFSHTATSRPDESGTATSNGAHRN